MTATKQQALEYLKDLLSETDTILIINRKVTRTINGNTRYKPSFLVSPKLNPAKLEDITREIAIAFNFKLLEVNGNYAISTRYYAPKDIINLLSVTLFQEQSLMCQVI